MSEWRAIENFPGYSISDDGDVRNDNTGRLLRLMANQSGLAIVGLRRGLTQYKRGVALLVAETYLYFAQPYRTFDTPINLNGDRFDNRVTNLVWRPRWFAAKYFRQFKFGGVCLNEPIEEIHTHEYFKSSRDAATKYGLLEFEIADSTFNRSPVWPTKQEFRRL